MSKKTAVLLLQMGGPDSLSAIEPFLYNLFSDRDIIRIGPAFLQPMIARFIARRRSKKVMEYYKKIGGKSQPWKTTGPMALHTAKIRLAGARGRSHRAKNSDIVSRLSAHCTIPILESGAHASKLKSPTAQITHTS